MKEKFLKTSKNLIRTTLGKVIAILLIFTLVVSITIPIIVRKYYEDSFGRFFLEDDAAGYVSRSQFVDLAKQEVVNECCNYSGESKVKISYGTENISADTMNDGSEIWVGSFSGYFYPVDKYGDYGDRYVFDIVIMSYQATPYAVVVDKNIYKKNY